MQRVAAAALVLLAIVFGASEPAHAQPCNIQIQTNFVPCPPQTVTTTTTATIPPLGIYAMGGIACAAISPMIGTIILGRELTVPEATQTTLSCFLGPIGWFLAPALFPPGQLASVNPGSGPQNNAPPRKPRTPQQQSRNINDPPRGALFLPDEILVEFDAGASAQYITELANSLQITLLESQTFGLTGRTLQRWRIIGNGTVRQTLNKLKTATQVSAGQANFVYRGMQTQAQAAPAPTQEAESSANPAQYVVPKLHLLEAHRITGGDDVVVAVIDSKIDTKHPDLAGVFAGEYDVLANPQAAAHAHGTGMAGAIAAHSKLLGVAPKVKLLAVRAFAGENESAQGTTFNILKGVDWAVSKGARIINMSFAGPPDPMLRNMLGNANLRGVVLIAAVGNAGPKSPPLYPAAEADVIGVTATDADDKLLKLSVRGPQVAVAAPGVQILEPAPDGTYQVTTGTSVAAAHVSGVAALLLARNPNLKPAEVREILIKSAREIPGKKTDVGAGVIDALRAVDLVRE